MKSYKTLLIGLGGIAVLAAVLVPNAYFIQSVQPRPRGRPAETDPGDVLKARNRLVQAVTFKTVSAKPDSGPEFDKQKDFLRTEFQPLFSDPRVTVETISDRSLLVTWKGSDPSLPGVLLTAHLDVVPVEYDPSDKTSPETKGWDHDPFKDAGLDGIIWGRGTLDDKVSVLAILEAAEGLLRSGRKPARTLYFGFGQDEEIGGTKGATQIAATLKKRLQGKKLECVIDEGTAIVSDFIPGLKRPIAPIGLVEKGYVDIILTATGPGGHSSIAPDRTAIGILSQAIDRLERNPLPTEMPDITRETLTTLAPEMGIDLRIVFANLWLFRPLVLPVFAANPEMNAMVRTTAAVTVSKGGDKDNVLPETATAIVNFRILPGTTPSEVLEHVRQIVADLKRVKVEIDPKNNFPPSHQSSTDTPSFRMLRQTIRDVFEKADPVVVPFLVTAGTDARFYEEICDNVYRFLPIQLKPDELEMIHGVNEQIRAQDYDQVVVFYRELMENAMRPDLGQNKWTGTLPGGKPTVEHEPSLGR
ncbi:MAG: M20 family peptidase [Isosphaeraceae bacterium]